MRNQGVSVVMIIEESSFSARSVDFSCVFIARASSIECWLSGKRVSLSLSFVLLDGHNLITSESGGVELMRSCSSIPLFLYISDASIILFLGGLINTRAHALPLFLYLSSSIVWFIIAFCTAPTSCFLSNLNLFVRGRAGLFAHQGTRTSII